MRAGEPGAGALRVRIGVISDTHGLLRAEAIAALEGSEHILHAGDVGDAAILERLRHIAPVTAIRGNIDRSGACAQLPATEFVALGGRNIYMLHDRHALDLDAGSAGVAVVISGHSHKPSIQWLKGVLYFNPGSAGPRRFSLPISVGRLEIGEAEIRAEIIEIAPE
jgi:putative phosphoesterase